MAIRFGSVCSGIEAATVAWSPLGWTPQWYAEVDPFCRDLLAHHYPSTYCYMDLNDITEALLSGDPDNAPEPIDLLVGGTPCQAFSIAGGRAGLDDPRGDVTLQWLRLVRAIKPRWLVWENVPGVLSIDGGRTFGTILGTLGELGYGVAYRVLDAQYFGVPQRRRRVFVVGYLGDWRRAAAVLFEPPSVQGNPAPRRGKGTAVAALTSTGVGTCGADGNQGQAGHLIAHTLRAEGFDASEDGTGRGTPLVPVTAPPLSYALNAKGGSGRMDGESETLLPVWLNGRQDPITAPQCGPLDTDPNTNVVAYQCHGSNVGPMGTLRKGEGGVTSGVPFVGPVAFNLRGRSHGSQPEPAPNNCASLRASQGGSSNSYIAGQVGVRRITPMEAERLQGFPDSYTAIPGPNGKPPADGPRYRALGNSMAVPVMVWIGRRIDLMEKLIRRGLV